MKSVFFSVVLFFVLSQTLLLSCKSNQISNAEEVEAIFNLETTACLGECPVFEVTLYGDKKLVFEGQENTPLKGTHKKVLTDEQFESLLAIIETANWNTLENSYTSTRTDLPTQNFSYNRGGLNRKVTKYGLEPQALGQLPDLIRTFLEEQVFEE